MPPAHEYHLWHLIVTGIASAGGGAAVWKWISDKYRAIIEAMPPLPDNASWKQKWLYAALHTIAQPSKAVS